MEYMPAARQKVHTRQHSQICRLQNASGKQMRIGATNGMHGILCRTGVIAGRIFFFPDIQNSICYIGHIGGKLRTVTYG